MQHDLATLTGTTLSVPIQSVDPARSFLVFTTAVSSVEPSDGQVVGQLVNDVEIQFERTSVGAPIAISWYVVTHPTIVVARGSADLETDPPIPMVDLARTFPIVTHATDGSDYNEDDYISAQLLGPQSLHLELGDSAVANQVEWQLVSWDEIEVSRAGSSVPAMASGVGVGPQPNVDPSRTFLQISWSTPLDQIGIACNSILGWIENTQLRARRETNACWTVAFTAYIVRTPNMRVQTGILSLDATETESKVTLSPVDTGRSFAILSGLTGSTTYPGMAMTDDDPGVAMFTADLRSPTELVLARAITRGAPANVSWYVVELP